MLMKNKFFWGWFFKIIAIILLITPLTFLAYTNKENWFVNNSYRVSFGFILTFIFAILLLKNAFKNLDKRLTTICFLITMSVIVWLLDSIIDDLFMILVCCLTGYVIYLIFDTVGSHLVEIYKVYKNEKIRNQARDDYQLKNNKNNNDEVIMAGNV